MLYAVTLVSASLYTGFSNNVTLRVDSPNGSWTFSKIATPFSFNGAVTLVPSGNVSSITPLVIRLPFLASFATTSTTAIPWVLLILV